MKKPKAAKQTETTLTAREARLIDGLRRHPEMMERMAGILDLARNEGPLKTADEVEELLIEEIRKLGQSTMSQWAMGAEERVAQETQDHDSTIVSRKKKR